MDFERGGRGEDLDAPPLGEAQNLAGLTVANDDAGMYDGIPLHQNSLRIDPVQP